METDWCLGRRMLRSQQYGRCHRESLREIARKLRAKHPLSYGKRSLQSVVASLAWARFKELPKDKQQPCIELVVAPQLKGVRGRGGRFISTISDAASVGSLIVPPQ